MKVYAVIVVQEDGKFKLCQDAYSRLKDAQKVIENFEPVPEQVSPVKYKDSEGVEYVICRLQVVPPIRQQFWAVNTKFFDSGRVKVTVYPVYADEKPENGSQENRMCDEYIDYFDTQEEASAWAEQARKA